MKKELAAIVLAGLVNTASAGGTYETSKPSPENPDQPTQSHEESALISSRKRKFDLAPHLTGTRERRRAAEAGAAIEIEIP